MTGEMRKVEFVGKVYNPKLSSNHKYMKFYDRDIDFWEDRKYLWDIVKLIRDDNSFSWSRFKDVSGVTPQTLTAIKKRLVGKGAIVLFDGEFYLNPCIASKGATINKDLWDMFSEKNSKLYGINQF